MEAILPALLAILLAETGGRTQALVHAAGLERPSGSVLAALLPPTVVGLGIAAFGGAAIAHMLTPDARTLLAGLALVLAALPMFVTRRKPATVPRRLTLGIAKSQFGDAGQFIVFAIAAQAALPLLALLGGVLGTLAAMLPPLVMRHDWPGALPLRWLRTAAAVLLLVAGLWLGVVALRLI